MQTRGPQGLPQRKWIRLAGWDYRTAGGYFVTICTAERRCILARVEDGESNPSEYGRIVEGCWQRLPEHFTDLVLDAFVIMPNHIHGVIVLPDVGATGDAAADEALRDGGSERAPCQGVPLPPSRNASSLRPRSMRTGRGIGTKAGSLGAVVQNLKSISARQVNHLRGTPGAPVWQNGYYERIIRDERELEAIRRYIVANPAAWEDDRENPAATAGRRR